MRLATIYSVLALVAPVLGDNFHLRYRPTATTTQPTTPRSEGRLDGRQVLALTACIRVQAGTSVNIVPPQLTELLPPTTVTRTTLSTLPPTTAATAGS
jgi:hypothetical protein